MPALTSVLLLCHNKLEYTRRCVESLRQYTDPALYELVIIDNASTDDTPAFTAALEREMPNLRVVRNDENIHFVRGNNSGAEIASGKYLFFLNNDTEVQPAWLETLVTPLENDPTIGAIGSKLIYPDGRLQEAGGLIFRDGTVWNFGKFGDPNDPEYNYMREVDYCTGAALMVRAELFRASGGFDLQYVPIYWEDCDICFSVRKSGYRVIYQPRSRITHYEGVTSGTDVMSGLKRHQELNRPKFLLKWAREMAEQPPPPPDMKFARMVSDRRCRNGKRVFMVVDYPPQPTGNPRDRAMHQMIDSLIMTGHHVTLAVRYTVCPPDIDLWPQVEAFRDHGVLVVPLDQIRREDAVQVPREQLARILQCRDYDCALVWTEHGARWVSEQIALYSPTTPVFLSMDPASNLPIFVPGASTIFLGGGGDNGLMFDDVMVSIRAQHTTSTMSTMEAVSDQHSTPTIATAAAVEPATSASVRSVPLTNAQLTQCISFGHGFYADEGGWRWMSQVGDLFIWSQAISRRPIINFELSCETADHYSSFPVVVRIFREHALIGEVALATPQQNQLIRIPLSESAHDICLRFESKTVFSPAQLGLSHDKRLLSVRISNVRLVFDI